MIRERILKSALPREKKFRNPVWNKINLLLFIFILVSFSGDAQDIFDAARKGDIKKLEELVKLNPDTVNSRDGNGFTPLIIAGYRNQLIAAEFLLNHKADINAGSPEGPAILGACYKGNITLTQMLIKYKADVNAQNAQGTTALMYATLSNNIELVKLLLKNGANRNLAEKSGKTALGYAQQNNLKEMTHLLSE